VYFRALKTGFPAINQQANRLNAFNGLTNKEPEASRNQSYNSPQAGQTEVEGQQKRWES